LTPDTFLSFGTCKVTPNARASAIRTPLITLAPPKVMAAPAALEHSDFVFPLVDHKSEPHDNNLVVGFGRSPSMLRPLK